MLAEKLTEAINMRNNDITSFVWKYKRSEDGTQTEIRLVDATDDQLKEFYKHAMSMLYNTNKKSRGRYAVRKLIRQQRNKCNVELYIRKLRSGDFSGGESYPQHLYWEQIRNRIKDERDPIPEHKLSEVPISYITANLPREFGYLSIASVLDGCMDALGALDTSYLSFNFLIKLGVYLTPEELENYYEKNPDSKNKKKPEIIKEELGLDPSFQIKISPSGLSLNELKTMIKLLTPYTKLYSKLTTEQLLILRNKVLFRLEQKIDHQIEQWEQIIDELNKVAESRGITLSE